MGRSEPGICGKILKFPIPVCKSRFFEPFCEKSIYLEIDIRDYFWTHSATGLKFDSEVQPQKSSGDLNLLLLLDASLNKEQERSLLSKLELMGLRVTPFASGESRLINIDSDVRKLPSHIFSQLPGVRKVIRLSQPFPLATASRKSSGYFQLQTELTQENDIVSSDLVSPELNRQETAPGACLRRMLAPWLIEESASRSGPVLIAGPCSVESKHQISTLATRVKSAGAEILRGGAFKPRTSPYEFCGLGLDGLKLLKEAGTFSGLPVVSEIMTCSQVEEAAPYVDIIQIGARNMYNYDLLKESGRSGKPILLKRGLSATIEEFLLATEYILNEGNENVILCERGIRTFEPSTRNTLDISAVPILKSMTALPVLVDPSHACGKASLVRPLSRAAIASGADGLLIEAHQDPSRSISDAEQAITPEELGLIADDMQAIASCLSGRDQDQPAMKMINPLNVILKQESHI